LEAFEQMKKYLFWPCLSAFFLLLAMASFAQPVSSLPQFKGWRGQKASFAPSRQELFTPQIKDNTIICGNKRLVVGENAVLTLWADSELLMEISYHFSLKERKSGDTRWARTGSRFMDSELSELRIDGTNFNFIGFVKEDNKPSWKVVEQQLELLPDGRISFSLNWFPPPDAELKFASYGALCMLPSAAAEGQSLVLNEQKVTMTSNTTETYLIRDNSAAFQYTLFAADSAREFFLSSTYVETFGSSFSTLLNKAQNNYRLTLPGNKDKRTLSFLLDLRKGVAAKVSQNIRGGIDFESIEDLEMPYEGGKNLLRNPSFEQGFHGYTMRQPSSSNHCSPELWQMKLYEIDDSVSYFGISSLKMQTSFGKCFDYRGLYTTDSLCSPLTVLPPDTYTLSCYAKGDQEEGQELNLWVPHFSTGNRTLAMPDALKTCKLGKDWQRFEFTFKTTVTMPLNFHVNAVNENQRGNVWVDGFQLEKGGRATAFATKAVEGRLYSSAADNFIAAGDKIDARLRLSTVANAKGKAHVVISNFFNEKVFSDVFPFVATPSGSAEILLPLDGKLGKGIFIIRSQYELENQEQCFDIHRLTISDFLKKEHPLKRMFSNTYGSDWARFDFLKMLERYKKIGIGSQHHLYRWDREIYERYSQYGIDTNDSFMGSDIFEPGSWQKKIGFGIRTKNDPVHYLTYPDCPELLIRDFHLDAGGKLTEEYLQKFKDIVKKVSAQHPWITLWAFQGEFKARFPNFWWSSEGSEKKAAEAHAKILKAFVDGVHEGNPKAKVYQDDPCNMSPVGGIAETDKLLEETNKLGVKFDVIAIHPYRYSPESPDLDEDTQSFLKMLEKRGYGDIPIYWPEMMHWGPYEIPQWNIVSADWGARAWDGARGALSYDMGWTEKLSAAWRARAWLVALKYSDRVLSAQSGNTNNFALDLDLTPFASQMVSNTLGNLLGDARFEQDIRFAPYVRAFVFSDSQKRPVAAVWCHLDKVDSGVVDAPVAEADFADSLESVFDLMNSARSFTVGKFRFPVSSFPLFLRGKPGTLAAMTAALEKALVVSGEGISPLTVAVNPATERELRLTLNNFLSQAFKGRLNGRSISVPGSGSAAINLPLPDPLRADKITALPLPVRIDNDSGASYSYDLSFEALLAKKVPAAADFSSIDWSSLPSTPFERDSGGKTSGSFRLGWNAAGLFVEVTVKDGSFVHVEYEKTEGRWKNDCLQLYIDSMANARTRSFKGYDEDDYDYAIFPNAAGDESIVFRYRSVEQQLGLGTQAPRDMTVAEDIRSSFSKRDDVLTYRVFIQAKYLLPMRLETGWCFGLGLYAANADQPGKVDSALTLANDGKGCYNKPHTWPAVLLVE
jgi:hypothetical protein